MKLSLIVCWWWSSSSLVLGSELVSKESAELIKVNKVVASEGVSIDRYQPAIIGDHVTLSTNFINSSEFESSLLFPELGLEEKFKFSHLLSQRFDTEEEEELGFGIEKVLSLLRHRLGRRLELEDDFRFAASHTLFYLVLERFNFILVRLIEFFLEGDYENSAIGAFTHSWKVSFHEVMHVIRKYGVMPASIYVANSEQIGDLDSPNMTILRLLFLDSYKRFKSAHQNGSTKEELLEMKEEVMTKIYMVLVMANQKPPETIYWSAPKKTKKAKEGAEVKSGSKEKDDKGNNSNNCEAAKASIKEVTEVIESIVHSIEIGSIATVKVNEASVAIDVGANSEVLNEAIPEDEVSKDNQESSSESDSESEEEPPNSKKFSTKEKVTPKRLFEMLRIDFTEEYVTVAVNPREPFEMVKLADKTWKTVVDEPWENEWLAVPHAELMALIRRNLEARRIVYVKFAKYTETFCNEDGVAEAPGLELAKLFHLPNLEMPSYVPMLFDNVWSSQVGLIVGYNLDPVTDRITRYLIESQSQFTAINFKGHLSASPEFLEKLIISVTVPKSTLTAEMQSVWERK